MRYFIDGGRHGKKEGDEKKKKKASSSSKKGRPGTTGKTYSRNPEASRKHPSDSQPLTAEEARQLQKEWMKRYSSFLLQNVFIRRRKYFKTITKCFLSDYSFQIQPGRGK